MDLSAIDNLHRRILESQSTPLLVVDHDERLCYLNPAAEDLFAVSARRVIQVPLGELIPGDRQLHAAIRRTREGNAPVVQRDITLPHAQGELVADLFLSPMDDGSGRVIVELARRDLVARADRDARLMEQQAVLDKLLRGLAHEIKNPLGGLRGAAQLLERELPEAALREYTGVIIREADRLQALVDQILGPRGGLRRRVLNIHEVVEHVHTLVRLDLPPGVSLERDYDPSLPELLGDRDLLIQALLNVVRNAVEAVDGKGRIVLRTRAVRHVAVGGRTLRLAVRLEVEDDGPGVPEAIRDEIFFPMVTGRAEGCGLGLSIAQSAVNRHGGLVQFESAPGRTVFAIILPLEQPEEVEGEHAP